MQLSSKLSSSVNLTSSASAVWNDMGDELSAPVRVVTQEHSAAAVLLTRVNATLKVEASSERLPQRNNPKCLSATAEGGAESVRGARKRYSSETPMEDRG